MKNRPLVRILCLPDVDRAIGGVKQLYRHVEHLCALGWDAAIVTEAIGFKPSWFESSAPTVSLHESYECGHFQAENVVLVLPETYLGVDLKAFRGLDLSRLARVVFNQNAYYSFGDFCKETSTLLRMFYDDKSVLQVLSISEDTHAFLSRNLGIDDHRISRIVNAIEPIFRPDCMKKQSMLWMTRKNPQQVNAVLQGIQRGSMRHIAGWQGFPIDSLTHREVADHFNSAQIYLSFGHPEGFGLPIAEAMASGCWVVGFSGGGGRELFRFGASEEVSYGDWPQFLAAIQRSLDQFALAPRETALKLERQALAVKALYGVDQERSSIEVAWNRISKAFEIWREAQSHLH